MMTLSPAEIFLRLGAAFLAGILLGMERETHGRPAGLRTTVLTCLAAATAALLAHEFTVVYGSNGNGGLRSDPGRLTAGVLTGIGFLGAGTILRHGAIVRGVTTAAVLWLSTIIGLVLGSGQWALGFCALAFGGATLGILPIFEDRITRNSYATIAITLSNEAEEAAARRAVEACGAKIQSADFEHDLVEKRFTIRYRVKFKALDSLALAERLMKELRAGSGVLAVRWE
jgi:putative Mg2+ transporter-C (MgtC) family protein